MKTVRITFGILLSILGLVGIFFGALSILDPIGAMLADDHNPSAKPPTLSENLWVIALYVVILLGGCCLLFWPAMRKKIALNKSVERDRAIKEPFRSKQF